MQQTGLYLLDTNIVIGLLASDSSICNSFSSIQFSGLPITVLGELYFGAYLSSKKEKNIAALQQLVKTLTVYQTSDDVSVKYGEVKSELKNQGTPIPENDIWIAAITLSYQATLVTRDSHFNNIKGLQIVRW